MLTATLKEKTCTAPGCGRLFMPVRLMQSVCSPACASRKVRSEKKREREEIRKRKEAIKTIPTLIREAQHAFNAYIRHRDKDKPCICCGQPLSMGNEVSGGSFDAGHYRSVGSASHLRFEESNVHGQRKACNRYGAGRAVNFRIGLIDRIGELAVLRLERDNRVHKWTREELIEIKDTYRRKLRELKAGRLE